MVKLLASLRHLWLASEQRDIMQMVESEIVLRLLIVGAGFAPHRLSCQQVIVWQMA